MPLALFDQPLKELAKLLRGGRLSPSDPLDVVHGPDDRSWSLLLIFSFELGRLELNKGSKDRRIGGGEGGGGRRKRRHRRRRRK